MGKTKNNAKKGKTVTFKMSEYQLEQLQQCCDVMEITQSDFIRQAVTNQIGLVYMQGMMSKMYSAVSAFSEEIKQKGLNGEYEKQIEEMEKYIGLYSSIIGGIKENE